MNRYKVWVRLEADFDDIVARNEGEAFIEASDDAMSGCDWEYEVELLEEGVEED